MSYSLATKTEARREEASFAQPNQKVPRDLLVYCGQWTGRLKNEGNVSFRRMIKFAQPYYAIGSEEENRLLAKSIYDTFNKHGRFLTEMKEPDAIDKIKQALRTNIADMIAHVENHGGGRDGASRVVDKLNAATLTMYDAEPICVTSNGMDTEISVETADEITRAVEQTDAQVDRAVSAGEETNRRRNFQHNATANSGSFGVSNLSGFSQLSNRSWNNMAVDRTPSLVPSTQPSSDVRQKAERFWGGLGNTAFSEEQKLQIMMIYQHVHGTFVAPPSDQSAANSDATFDEMIHSLASTSIAGDDYSVMSEAQYSVMSEARTSVYSAARTLDRVDEGDSKPNYQRSGEQHTMNDDDQHLMPPPRPRLGDEEGSSTRPGSFSRRNARLPG